MLFCFWACGGEPPDPTGVAPARPDTPWEVSTRDNGLRCRVGPVRSGPDGMAQALEQFHDLVARVERVCGSHQVRERVVGLRLPLPTPLPTQDELLDACQLVAPLVSPLLPLGRSSRVAVLVHNGELRVGWSGQVSAEHFDVVIPLTGLALYTCLRDLRWNTLPVGLVRWPQAVQPARAGFRIAAVEGERRTAEPLWHALHASLVQRLPDALLYRAGRVLGLHARASPMERLRSFLVGDALSADGGKAIHDDRAGFVEALRTRALFESLTRTELRALVEEGRPSSYATGATLVRQGDPGTSVFLITRGRVGVVVEADGQSRQVAQLEVGSLVGELCLLDGRPRSATVRALEYVEVLEIMRSDFLPLFEANPHLAQELHGRLLAVGPDQLAPGALERPETVAMTAEIVQLGWSLDPDDDT